MTESQFSARFAAEYQSFKTVYLKRRDLARTHCHIVQGLLEALGKRRAWMANLPLADRAFRDLERLSSKWIACDPIIVGELESFFDTLNAFMDEIADRARTGPMEGLKILTDGLKPIESKFKDISAQLEQLDALGRRL